MPVNKSAMTRYFVIDDCLTNSMRRYPKLEEILDAIHSKLGQVVSQSTLNKDFASMKEIFDAPIKFNRSAGGYYYDNPTFSIRQLPITQEEMVALNISTLLVQQIKGTKILDKFLNAVSKILNGKRNISTNMAPQRPFIQLEDVQELLIPGLLETLMNATIEHNSVKITYKPFDKPTTIHIVSPYLLKQYRNRWYVIGHSDVARKTIVFALDRICEIQKSLKKFIPDPSFDPNEYFKYSFGVTQIHNKQPEEVILSFEPQQAKYILTAKLHSSQETIIKSEQEVKIKLHVYITQELIMMILGYGNRIRVVSPESLKSQIINAIDDMKKIY